MLTHKIQLNFPGKSRIARRRYNRVLGPGKFPASVIMSKIHFLCENGNWRRCRMGVYVSERFKLRPRGWNLQLGGRPRMQGMNECDRSTVGRSSEPSKLDFNVFMCVALCMLWMEWMLNRFSNTPQRCNSWFDNSIIYQFCTMWMSGRVNASECFCWRRLNAPP